MISQKSLPVQLALTIVSALLVPLCFPPHGWWPLVFLSYPPLLLAATNTTPIRAFYLGMLHGLIGFGITLSWLYLIFGLPSVPLYTILATFTGLICLLTNAVAKRDLSPHLKVAAAAVIWTGIEYYRAEIFFLRFPWVTPGTAMGPTWLSPILGVYGMSFLVIAAGVAIMTKRTATLGLALSLVVVCLGIFRPGKLESDPERSITVTVVQSEACFLAPYIALTEPALVGAPDLIIWPEYALPYDVRENAKSYATLVEHCQEMGAVFVIGTKTNIRSGPAGWRNTALTLDKGIAMGEYYKIRPVHFFDDGTPGSEFDPVSTRLGKMGTPICFDCDYTDVTRRMVDAGAEFFAVPSFDSETWSACQHFQHAILFRIRAAETGRWIACAASSGVSQVIDSHGNVHASIAPFDPGTVTSKISRNSHKTFFVRAGWVFPWIALAITALLILNELRRVILSRMRRVSELVEK